MIEHQIAALAKAGVTDIVLAVNYRPEAMMTQLEKYEKEYNVKVHFSVETEPLGTGTPHGTRIGHGIEAVRDGQCLVYIFGCC